MNTDLINVNEYAIKIYNQNVSVGWWDNPDRCIFQTLQLVNTEIAEATEGDRKNLNDSHLPHRKMVEVELADVFIRIVDLAGRYNWNYDKSYPDYRLKFAKNLATKHLIITMRVCEFATFLFAFRGDERVINRQYANIQYSKIISTIFKISEDEGYDLQGAIDEKIEYNKTRLDHTRENRGKHFDGKKY